MTTKDAALRLALDTLQNIQALMTTSYKARNGRQCGIEDSSGEMCYIVPHEPIIEIPTAIAAIREVLTQPKEINCMSKWPFETAQPQQEPRPCCEQYDTCTESCGALVETLRERLAQPRQEPVCGMSPTILEALQMHPDGHTVLCGARNPSRTIPLFALPTQPDPMSDVADRFTHRLALELECVLADRPGCYNRALDVLGEYRSAMNAIHEQHSPTYMGEPLITGETK